MFLGLPESGREDSLGGYSRMPDPFSISFLTLATSFILTVLFLLAWRNQKEIKNEKETDSYYPTIEDITKK